MSQRRSPWRREAAIPIPLQPSRIRPLSTQGHPRLRPRVSIYLSLDDGEDLLGHGDGVVDVLVVVGQAHEARLVRVRVSGQWSGSGLGSGLGQGKN